jgi:hypothetical protein
VSGQHKLIAVTMGNTDLLNWGSFSFASSDGGESETTNLFFFLIYEGGETSN